MISIIICSRSSDIPVQLRHNITDTVGCEYELIVIDNSANCYNIFSAYNEGVRRAKGEILCFCHDDILFHTQGWGNAVADELQDKGIGIIGVAGTHFLSNAPCYWWSSPFISQNNLSTNHGATTHELHADYFHNGLADAVAVDGLCLFLPKEMFQEVKFDDKAFHGFHGYDMDISLQVLAAGKRVCVTDKVLVEHFWSADSFNNPVYMKLLNEAIETLYHKWQHLLPLHRGIEESELVLQRLNNLFVRAYQAEKTRQSLSYRLGRRLTAPFRWLKRKK